MKETIKALAVWAGFFGGFILSIFCLYQSFSLLTLGDVLGFILVFFFAFLGAPLVMMPFIIWGLGEDF